MNGSVVFLFFKRERGALLFLYGVGGEWFVGLRFFLNLKYSFLFFYRVIRVVNMAYFYYVFLGTRRCRLLEFRFFVFKV